jgi:hypothetical protein
MDSSINPDLIALAANLALAVNLVGGIVFAVVIRHLWLASEGNIKAPRRAHTAGPATTTQSCPAL